MTYDEAGEIESTTLPRHPDQYGHSITIQYDRNAVGDPVTIHDGRGTSFDNEFLDTGELRQTDRPSWWSGGAGQDQRALPKSKGEGDFGAVTPQQMPGLMPRAGTTTLDYDNELRLLSVTDAAGNSQSVDYDDTGRVIRREIPFKAGSAPQSCAERDPDAEPTAGPIVMTTAYDLNGNRRFMRDGRCQESTWDYDQFDRSVAATEPAGWTGPKAITKLSYDRNGNTVKSALPRDPDKAFERMAYDDVDRLESKVEPFDAGEGSPRSEWRYRYDANNNKIREIRPRSQAPGGTDTAFTTKLEYDEADQLDSVTNSAGHETTYEYDDDGNQTKVTAPGAARANDDPGDVRGQVTRTEFDGRGLPWVQSTGTGADARTTVTEYDGNGNLRRSVNPKGVEGDRPRYGDIGRDAAMSTATRASWNATVNEYTEDGLLRARYLPWDEADDGERWKQTHTYNTRGWPTGVSEAGCDVPIDVKRCGWCVRSARRRR